LCRIARYVDARAVSIPDRSMAGARGGVAGAAAHAFRRKGSQARGAGALNRGNQSPYARDARADPGPRAAEVKPRGFVALLTPLAETSLSIDHPLRHRTIRCHPLGLLATCATLHWRLVAHIFRASRRRP